MTIFDVLHRHRNEIEELVGDVRNAVATGQRELARVTFQLLALKLGACIRAEHAVVYPQFERLGLDDEVADARRDHVAIEASIDQLRIAGLTGNAWDAELDRLARLVQRHVESEEYTLLPMAALSVSTELARELADAYTTHYGIAAMVAGPSITYAPPVAEVVVSFAAPRSEPAKRAPAAIPPLDFTEEEPTRIVNVDWSQRPAA